MPIIYEDRVEGEARSAFDIPSSRDEVLTEQFAQSFEENPIKAVMRYKELTEDMQTGPRLDAAAARERLKAAGMESDLTVSDAGITEAGLMTLMERKRIEKRRQETFALSEGGAGEMAQRFGIAAMTSLVDPIAAGLNFVPVVGQARYARMLEQAGGLAGRIGVRGAVGAAEGAAGASIAEVPIYAMRTQEQSDYDTVDSLMNVALGGVVGSGLHSVVGSLGELAVRPDGGIPRATDLGLAERAIERRLARRVSSDTDGAIAEYSRLEGTNGGQVLNTDLARELSPEYRADRTRSAAVHEPASWLVKRMYERRLAQSTGPDQDALVVFSAGGTGAGKSTGLSLLAEADPRYSRAQIIYDTNLNGLTSSVQKIEQALAANKAVEIVYTYRDPVESLVNGALIRAMRMGRTVPLNEHARTHVGAAETIKQLAARYAADDRVQIRAIDNSQGRGGARQMDVAAVPVLDYNRVRGDLRTALEAARELGPERGGISQAIYRGTAEREVPSGRRIGPGNRQRLEPEISEEGLNLSVGDRVGALPSTAQEALLRRAVNQAAVGEQIDVSRFLNGEDRTLPLDPDYRAATMQADRTLAAAPKGDDITRRLTESADLAEAEARDTATKLGVEFDDADMTDVVEAVAKAERWSRAAELATVCLTRGD